MCSTAVTEISQAQMGQRVQRAQSGPPQAQARDSLGDTASLLGHCDNALSSTRNWSQVSLPSDPATLVDLARRDLAGGEIAAAQEKCLEVLASHHHHPGALEVLGTTLHSQGKYEEAVRVFNALTLMQPTLAVHWQNLGTVLRPTGRQAESLAAFERALRLGPPTAGLLN